MTYMRDVISTGGPLLENSANLIYLMGYIVSIRFLETFLDIPSGFLLFSNQVLITSKMPL